MSYLVGLTGGIGSGKSTVASLFAQQGARIIDTDLISHRLTQSGGAAIPALRASFGDSFITADGSLDRARMRELVFSNAAERRRLECILHPLILAQAKEEAAAETSAPYTIVVVPLLFESGDYATWLSRIVVVDCPEEQQVARTVGRSRLDGRSVLAIMAQQLRRNERLRLADDIIHNDDGLDELKPQVDQMHLRLLELSAESD